MSNNDALSSLAFLYLTFSHATDGTLSMDEMRTLGTKIQGWAPQESLETVGAVIKGAVEAYKAVPAGERLSTAKAKAQSLASFADAGARAKIVEDLESLASADGTVSDGERMFIDDLKSALGV